MHVQFDPTFFKKERDQAYSDWEFSIWRELFQNSIDQNATEIRIGIEPGDNCVKLLFIDNGPGMTRSVLTTVYFNVGATTKTGTNQIGGMGRARILTCFAMKSYLIRSDDYLVIGNGGDYEVVNAPVTRGCTLFIEAEDTTVEYMTSKLLAFLGECRLQTKVYLNDVRVTAHSAHLGRHARDLMVRNETFAKVYVNKSVGSHRVIVRVHGVSMYSTYASANAQIIVELEPHIARQALTSNRDGLRGLYRETLDSFLRELAVDTKSSLRPRFTSRTTVARNGGMLKLKSQARQKAERKIQSDWTASSEPAPTSRLAHDGNDTFTETAIGRDVFGRWLEQTFGDIYIFDETETTSMHKVVASYSPENWQPTTVNGRTFRKGANIVKVLLMWRTAIQYALEVSLDVIKIDSLSYSVGFLFTDDRLAEHRTNGDGHLFLLRPVTLNGKRDYSVRDRMSLKKLMTHAKHEVAHINKRWHDEEFSGIREQIDQVFDEAECFRRMKEALKAVPDFDRQQITRMAA